MHTPSSWTFWLSVILVVLAVIATFVNFRSLASMRSGWPLLATPFSCWAAGSRRRSVRRDATFCPSEFKHCWLSRPQERARLRWVSPSVPLLSD